MPANHSSKPTYVGIGAQKCASTWLHRILAEHPEVSVPHVKELNFFSYRYDHGYQWYERCFQSGKSSRARGEISPSYFAEPAVPERVAATCPGPRSYCRYVTRWSARCPITATKCARGTLGADLSFETGLANNPMYVQQGLYATHLKSWLRHFPRADILVVLMEDIESDPLAVSKAVYQFLGVDDGYIPAGLVNRYNRSFATRWSPLGGMKDAVYSATRLPGLRWFWDAAARVGLRSLYRGINNVPSSSVIPQPNAQTLLQLRQQFAPEIRELETIIGRSLATWL